MSRVVDDFNDIRWDARGTAQQKARTALREQNKREWVCDLALVGTIEIAAGSTFIIESFGVFDGKYIAEKVEHRLSGDGGYITAVKGRRTLEGY